MYCSNCGQAIVEGARFCAGCGAAAQVAIAATLFCASCGTSIPQAGQFCPACGQPAARAPAYGATTMPRAETRYGGFWQRFGARFLDGLIVLAFAFIPAIVVGVIVHQAVYPSDQLFVSDQQAANAETAGTWAGWGVYMLVSVMYFLIGWSTGGTWGLRAVGLRLVSTTTGGAPGLGSALARLIVQYISAIPLYLGFLWMLWDDKKQTWHDKVAGTIVVARN